ncbi:LptF/LptG family permease [bacterium]|nr:LptF/LptG family permease [bacterium]
MFLLARYILREHIGPFFFALALITSMLVLNFVLQAMRYIIGKGISIQIILEYIIYNLAWIMVLVVPMSVLVATIMAFGRMSSDNEVTAIKAGGISFYSLIMPVLLASVMLAIALVEFNDKVLPVANHKARVLKKNIQNKRPTLSIEPGVFLEDLENFSMIVENKDELGSGIYGVTIVDKSQHNVWRTIVAEKGKIEIDESSEAMIVTLENGEIHEMNFRKMEAYQTIHFAVHRVNIPVENLTLKKNDETFHNDREKNIQQLMDDVLRHQNERDRRLDLAATALSQEPAMFTQIDKKFQTMANDFFLQNSVFAKINEWFVRINLNDTSSVIKTKAELSDDIRQFLRSVVKDSAKTDSVTSSVLKNSIGRLIKKDSLQAINASILPDTSRNSKIMTSQQLASNLSSATNYQRMIDQLMVEVNKKYSIPMACIIFVLLGAPIGVKARRGNLGIAGGISLFFFIAYYFCLVLGEDYADRQLLNPFFAMWFPNLILGLIGMVLTYQTASERTFGLHGIILWILDKLIYPIKKLFSSQKVRS